MSVGGDVRPFREKYSGYASVFPGTLAAHYRPMLGTVKKNTTVASYDTYNCRGCYTDGGFIPVTKSVDPDTGKSTLGSVPYFTTCACCVQGGIATPIVLTDNANTFAACDGLLAVTVTGQGDGHYLDGDVLTITGGYPETINGASQVATFKLKVTAGVIQSATVLTSGCYSGIGSNALTAQTTATGGHGTGATFGFTRKDAQFDFGKCNIVGWQAVAAARQWHGTFGFLDACYPCPTDGTQGDPPAEKYLAIAWDSHFQAALWYNFNVSPVGGYIPNSDDALPPPEGQDSSTSFLYQEITAEAVGGNSVSGENGVIQYGVVNNVLDSTNSGTIDNFTFDTFTYAKNGILVDGSGNPVLDSGNTISADSFFGAAYFLGEDYPYSFIGFPKCGEGVIPDPIDSPNYEDVILWQVEVSGGMVIDSGIGLPSFDAEYYYNNYDGADQYVALVCMVLKFQRENETYTWNVEHYVLDYCSAYNTDAGGVVYCWGITYGTFSHGTVTLSSPNKTAGTAPAEGDYDVMYDAENGLLSKWNLTDPVMMPLTAQPFDGTVVKVTRNEVGENVSPVVYEPLWIAGVPLVGGLPQVYVDPNLAILTANGLTAGQILGAPLATKPDDTTGLPPANQCGGDYPLDYFYSDFTTWVYGDCGTGSYSWDVLGYGDWRSNHPELPPRATQWTDAREGNRLTTGRNQKYHFQQDASDPSLTNKIWSTKWIETAVRLPSVNHARPFAVDRYTLSPTLFACVESFDGSVLTTRIYQPALTVGDTVAVVGTANDGIYTFTGMDGTTPIPNYMLTFISALPAGFPPMPVGDSDGIMAKIRWSNVPPMAGRLRIISITDNGDGTVTVTHEPMGILNAADSLNPVYNVDLADKTMTPLAANLLPNPEIIDSNGNRPGTTASTPGQKPLGAPVDYIPTPLTTSEFICTAAYATVKDSVWLTLYGALNADTSPMPPAEVAKWYWNDDRGKGQCWIGQWSLRNGVYVDALAQEYNKAFQYCSPTAIVLSPNAADTPTGLNYAGARYDFSGGFVADEFCGSERWLDVCQMTQDPYWVAPICCPPTGYHNCHPLNATPYVESRLILPHASGATTPPDNGADMGQDKVPPHGVANFIDYTVDLTAATGLGGNPPSSKNGFQQPASVLAPTGIYVPNLAGYCTFCVNIES